MENWSIEKENMQEMYQMWDLIQTQGEVLNAWRQISWDIIQTKGGVLYKMSSENMDTEIMEYESIEKGNHVTAVQDSGGFYSKL